MHFGWLKLTSYGHDIDAYPDGDVYIWAADVEMVRTIPAGAIVYLHHDKTYVCESAETIIEQVDKIRRCMGYYDDDPVLCSMRHHSACGRRAPILVNPQPTTVIPLALGVDG